MHTLFPVAATSSCSRLVLVDNFFATFSLGLCAPTATTRVIVLPQFIANLDRADHI